MPTATAERPEVIKGCETPRIFTPPKRELVPGTEENDYTDRTTDGYAAIAFAELLGFRLFPWQKWLLIHALELTEDGLYRFRFVIVLVGRQNGKSLLLLILALWHIYALGSKQVIGTAQDLSRADKAWEEAVNFAEDDEDLAELIEKVDRGHPKYLRLNTGCEYRVAAASRRGGRGFSGDLILLDELREHQTWQCWSAVTNAMNARPRGQAWGFSNAGDMLSVVLRYLRAQSHRELGWPDGDGDADILEALDAEMEEFLAEQAELGDAAETALFEWSAPPDAKRTDRRAWAQANPSMDHTDIVPDCVTQRVIAAALRTNPRAEFETEVLCRWQTMGEGGPFPEGSWRDTLNNEARPAEGSTRVACLAVSWNRTRSYIARSGFAEDDVPVAGIWQDRTGTDWAVPFLVEHRDKFDLLVVQSNGAPETSLIDAIESATLKDGKTPANLPLVKWGGPDLGSGNATLYDLLDNRNFRHLAHPGLDAAATTAAVKLLSQGATVIDLAKSPTDAAPLKAVVGAVWGLMHKKPETVQVWGFLS